MDDTVDENIRYSGASPKNYVEFGNDGELWRIIGIFNVTDSAGNTSKKLKIVRNEALGSFSWDAKLNPQTNDYRGINDWTNSYLMQELNGDYLNYNLTENKTNWYNSTWDSSTQTPLLIQTGTFNYQYTIKEKYQNYISENVWNVGGSTYNPGTDPKSLPTLEQYNAERGSITYQNSKASVWTGKIGLIYPSDYGYASTDEECRKDLRAGQVYNADTRTYDLTKANCKNENWLHKNMWYWTISPSSDYSSIVWYVAGENIIQTNNAFGSLGVFAATYLKSDTHFISGTGTQSDPYKLG